MSEDLLTRIQREMHERLEGLRGAVDEHDRLAGDLRALDAGLIPAAGNARRGSVGCELPRARMVSPKVARLMHAPRRPSLERPGLARISTSERSLLEDDLAAGVDLFPGADPCLGIDGVDVEAERYERSL